MPTVPLFIFTHAFFCIDSRQIHHQYPLQMQNVLLDKFFQRAQNFVERCASGMDTAQLCDWEGMHQLFQCTCVRGVLTGLEIQFAIASQFDVAYLPSTVRSLTITSSQQTFPIETRRLPARSVSVDLQMNNIYGAPDLRNLPLKLEVLNLASNELSGPISLVELPQSLHKLMLEQNRIDQAFLFYTNLPKMLSVTLRGNAIEHICGVTENEAVQPFSFIDFDQKRVS